jgi:DNA polymerase III subunit beta
MQKRFIVEQKQLLGVLSAMQPICTKRTTLDTTTYILFEVGPRELVLKSTDLEISLQSSCPMEESSLKEKYSFLIAGRRIFDIIKELEGPIVCDFSGNQFAVAAGAVTAGAVAAGSVKMALHIKDALEFPPFPERIENLMQLDAPLFLTMLESVAFLVPQNNTNPALNGLLLEINQQSLKMTTTDGHCLAQVRTETHSMQENRTWLLPRRAVFELKKILETSPDKTLFLGVCNQQLVFSGESFNFFTKLLVDHFPNYHAVLDKTAFTPASIDRSRFVKTLRRAACLLSGQFLATTFGFSPQLLRVSMLNKEVGTLDEELPVDGVPHAIDVRFYAPYLLNGLQVLGDEKITFYLTASTKPIIFESQDKGVHTTYLVMPVSPTN